jgi:hypothetical protein
MRCLGEPTERKEGDRSEVSAWVMKQVTLRGQSGQHEEDERSEVNVGLKMQQMDWGGNGHEMVSRGEKVSG